MSNQIIEVKNIGKEYFIGEKQKYLALRDKIAHPIRACRSARNRQDFWALKNISFEVNKGDVVGIIGKNGSGKSTLLKILSPLIKKCIAAQIEIPYPANI